jgi:hypothetical protein
VPAAQLELPRCATNTTAAVTGSTGCFPHLCSLKPNAVAAVDEPRGGYAYKRRAMAVIVVTNDPSQLLYWPVHSACWQFKPLLTALCPGSARLCFVVCFTLLCSLLYSALYAFSRSASRCWICFSNFVESAADSRVEYSMSTVQYSRV